MSKKKDIHANSNALIQRYLETRSTYELNLPNEVWSVLPRLLMAYNPAVADSINKQIIRQMTEKVKS
jgi:hypothetical protein